MAATAARFHTVVLVSVLVGLAATIDPVQLTEYTLIFSAIVLPLAYLPILDVPTTATTAAASAAASMADSPTSSSCST